MASAELPGLDVATRVLARDIQLSGVADVRRRILMISGAVDTVDHDVTVSITLPEPGRWTVIKAETNLTGQTWTAMQVTTDEDSTIVDDEAILCRQFARTFLTPDHRRLVFYGGEVRPGEAMLKTFTLDCGRQRPAYAHARYSPMPDATPEQSERKLERLIADGMPARPAVDMIVPVTVVD